MKTSWLVLLFSAALLPTLFYLEVGNAEPGRVTARAMTAHPEVEREMGSPDAGVDGGDVSTMEGELSRKAVDIGDAASAALPTTVENRPPLVYSVFVNPMSALTWGASAGFEMGRRVSLVVRLRAPNAGFLPYKVEGEGSEFVWGIGAAFSARWYPARRPRLSGFYLGVAAEYYHVEGIRPTYDWRLGYLGPELDIGYRWRFGHLLLGLGGSQGLLVNIHYKRTYWFKAEQSRESGHYIPVFELNLEIGWIGDLR